MEWVKIDWVTWNGSLTWNKGRWVKFQNTSIIAVLTLIFFIRTMVLNEKTLKFPKKLRTQHSQKNRWFLFRVNFWVEIRTTVKIRTINSK